MAKKTTRPHGSGPKLTSGNSPKPATPKRGSAKGSSKKQAAARARKSVSGGGGKKKASKQATPKRGFWMRKGFWSWTLSSLFVFGFFVLGALLYFAQGLPSIRGLETIDRQPGITIKTEDGLTLASYGDVYGQYVPYEQIPKHFIRAVLATEDRRFFEHSGIDVLGIARAMIANLRAGRLVQGGSTITQQVAKNVFLTPERTLKRKLQEMLLAFWLESHFSKEQILAIYLNRVYLGSGNYGIDAASRRYFDKPATDVNLIESAILTGLLKAPSRYSPLSSAERARDRAHQVLLNMVDAGYLSKADVKAALAAFRPPKLYREGDASGTRYFTDWLVDEIPLYIGKAEGDITVITTLDIALQRQGEDAVKRLLKEQGEAKQATQAALVTLASDGAIRAMVGGRSYQKSQYNRVTQALRQPGSVFKLFVYLAALEAGMAPNWIIEDRPLEVQAGHRIWRPSNFDHRFRGDITMLEALTDSINTVAVQLAEAVGFDRVVNMARRLGVTGIEVRPSVALGAVEANLLDLTAAYAHLANEGRGVQPYGIKAIYAQDGTPLYERKGSGLWVILRERVVRQMNYMLANAVQKGTGRRADIGRPMAGKTGTSSEFRDAWFIGYTPQLVTGVWVGNDDNSRMKRVTGGNLPAMIWNSYMSKAMQGKPELALMGADGVIVEEQTALPWHTEDEADPLDAFRDGEPNRLKTFRRYDDWQERNREQRSPPRLNERGPDLNKGFWDQLFGE